MPKKILDAIPPRPPGFGLHRELFPRTTGEGFDPLAPGDDRRRRDHRLRAAARSRGAAWWRSTRSIRRCPGSRK